MYPYQSYMQPMQSVQSRLSQMEQQFPQFAQNYQSQYSSYPQSNTLVLKGRPVSSYDEAKASMIDLDGSVFVFPDFGNQKIYTKQINLDGTATINTYSIDNNPKSSCGSLESPKSEPNQLDLINNLQNQIDALKDKIESLHTERGDKRAKSVHADDANTRHDAKPKSSNHQSNAE